MQRGGGAFGAVLVDETQANAGGQNDADDDRLCAVSEEERNHRGSRQQPEYGAAQLAPQHRDRADPMSANGIRAVPQQSRRCLRAGQPLGSGVGPPQHIGKWSRRDPGGGQRLDMCCIDNMDGLRDGALGGYRAAVSSTFNAPVSAALPKTS